MQLTSKETALLADLKSAEKLCAERYDRHAQAAKDPQLSGLFSRLADVEREHFDTLSQIEKGNPPQPPAQKQPPRPQFSQTYGLAESADKRADCFLCSDLLAAEKHASGMYDTSVFEFCDTRVRQLLNHIQTEEQQHGEQIYGYMSANGMY